jgi:DNA-binding winged helix-turn-helix (wHTH) protein
MRSSDKYPPSSRFGIGPLQIDLERGTVSAQDGSSGLTSRAERLLLLLARYPNLLVSREQILETVWAGRVVEDAAITNAIWQIRRALGQRGKEILQTRAKRGYVLVVADSDWIIDPQASPDDPRSRVVDTADAAGHLSESDPVGSAEDGEVAADDATAAAPVQVPASTRSPRSSLRIAAAVALVAITGAALAWRLLASAPERFALRPDVDMSISAPTPPQLDWLHAAVLRTAVETAYLHGGTVVHFQKAQTRNPFAGPHLQVRLISAANTDIEAELRITQGEFAVRERFRGPANALEPALRAMLTRTFGPAPMALSQAGEAYISGRVAQFRFDDQAALVEYRRAISRDPRVTEAKIAMAGILLAQGRAADAQSQLLALEGDSTLTPSQRCRFEVMLAQMPLGPSSTVKCPRALAIASLQRLELRDALQQLQRLSETPMSAQQWLEEENATILALLRLQEWQHAEYEIARAQRVAQEAGWEHARIEIGASRATLAIHRSRLDDAIRVRVRVAEEMEALGDVAAGLENRIWAIRPMQIVPGETVGRHRAELQKILDRAREIGSVRMQIDALRLLARLDRDRVEVWRLHLARARSLAEEAGLDRQQTLDPYFVVAELVFQQRYREAIETLAALEASGNRHPRARAWSLTLQTRAYFARDELSAAIAAVDAMEKEGLDVPGSADFCLLSWLFVEADRPDRARAYLKRCRAVEYDRAAQALRGDFGVLAEARLLQRDGESERAWSVLRPRLEALLALSEPTREEADSMTLLARHAAAMRGADRALLERVLGQSAAIAARDGAGPRLRLGVHLLRWRLCALARSDCGPVLLPWAAEERLEQRLATETAGR